MGLVLNQGGNYTSGSYNELITIYDITNTNINLCLPGQGVVANWEVNNLEVCDCVIPIQDVLYRIPVTLTQDFNDIGHYSVWDGLIDQQQVFSNFTFTANTTGNGYKIQIYNTTDFGSYKALAESPYTIYWGECDCSTPLNVNGYPCCETLSYPTLTSVYEYANSPSQYRVTINHNAPWGPTSVNKMITVPQLTYGQILGQAFSSAPVPLATGMGGGAATAGIPLSPTTPGGNPYQVNLSGPNPFPSVWPPPLFTSTSYHGTYGTIGTPNYYPLDSGININQYTGTTPFPCFEVTGITDSSVGIFSTYSNTPSSNLFLPPGFEVGVSLPVGGDVVDPITNTITPGMMGQVTAANAQWTGYTISSTNGNTPIQFYDFANGITIFVATSCGLNSLAFGGEDCFECPENTCEGCLTMDEYIDRVTLLPEIILPNAPGIPPNWSGFVDYTRGDVVYDVSPSDCCCYVLVAPEVIQTAGPSNSPWANIKPSQLYQGVWQNPTGTDVHVWEACTPDCISCPPGSILPCEDPYNPFNAYPNAAGQAGVWANGQTFNVGDFIFGNDGNCFRALVSIPSGIIPTASTNNTYWDYIGCSSWICPPDLNNPGPDICELISGSTVDSFTFYAGPGGCVTEYLDGYCPTDERYHCANPYGCDVPSCSAITYNHPAYSAATYPFSVTFSSLTDCLEWCNPVAWSCSTPTSTPCCTEISCAALPHSDYFDIMTDPSIILSTPLLTAQNSQVFLDPYYTPNDCEVGVTSQAIPACCDFTGWEWICDQGCVQIVGGQFSTPGACASAPGNNNGLPGICGWECYDPWFQPCSAVTWNPWPIQGQSACLPCFTNVAGGGCGNYTTSAECCTYCQPDHPDCYECVTGSTNPCQQHNPCPTPLPSWYATWIVNPANVPVSGYGPNDIHFPDGSGTYGATYATAVDCSNNCVMSGGVDCLIGVGQPPPAGNWGNPHPGGCQNWPSTLLPTGWSWSPGGPYATYNECCDATGCCDIVCDETDSIFDPLSTQYDPLWPWWPCVWAFASPSTPPPSPSGPVYGTFVQCTAHNPTGCYSGVTCECACDWLLGGNIGPLGVLMGTDLEYDMTEDYDLYDVVFHEVGQPHGCCYMCDCAIGANWFPGPPGYSKDCQYFEPGTGDDIDGTPNCWVSCLKTFSGQTGGCDPCTNATGDTYSCTPDGCTLNLIPCAYTLGLETINNCYNESTCNLECYAGCYCDDMGTLPTGDDISACVMLQDVLNANTTWTSTWYGYFSTNFCNVAISFGLDCCDPLPSKWHCDDSEWCSSLQPCVPPDGCGCVEIWDNHPSYSTAYADLATCQDNCIWACEIGVQGSLCHFVGNNPLGYFPEHSSAYDCWQNTNNCDCSTISTSWFCDTNPAQSATTSNCFQQSTIDAWVITPPFVGWTSSLVYGQNGTSVPYPMGPTAFASQTDCQQACRFCCDETVTCTCDLVPYDFNCHISIQDCVNDATANGPYGYPCCPHATTWYCCHETDGCISYLGGGTGLPMPAGCLSLNGPFTSPVMCQDHCHFLCGECGVDIGPAMQPDPCHCDVFNISIVAFSCPIVYNTMALCETSQYNTVLLEDGPSCCPCHECLTNGSVTFVTFAGSVFSLQTVNVTPPISGNILQADPYSSMITYAQGDVSISSGCCYVMVASWYGSLPQVETPADLYDDYANDLILAGLGGGPGYVIPTWIPCDNTCPLTAATPIYYECISYPPNPTPGYCGGKTFGGLTPNAMDTWNWISNPGNGVQNTPFSDIYFEDVGAPTGSNCEGVINGATHHLSFEVSFNLTVNNTASVWNGTTDTWADIVSWAQGLGATVNLSMDWDAFYLQVETQFPGTNTYTGMHTACSCWVQPCHCEICGPWNGANCIHTQPDCAALILNNPCCQPAPTGFFVCDTQNPNQTTGICPCIWDAAAVVGYIDMDACTGDTYTCCYDPPPVLISCISGATATTNTCDSGTYMDYTTACDTLACLGYNPCVSGQYGYVNNVEPVHNIVCTYGINQDITQIYYQYQGMPCNTNFWNQIPPECCGPNNKKLVHLTGMYHIYLNAGQNYLTWLDFMNAMQAAGIPGNGTLGIWYGNGPAQWGIINGYTMFQSMIVNAINTWWNVTMNGGGNYDVSNFKATRTTCNCSVVTLSGCTCVPDPINGIHVDVPTCEAAVNCCGPQIQQSWDCDPVSWTCYDPGTGLGFWTSANGGLLACQTACVPPTPACDDCWGILALYFTGPMSYQGSWVAGQTYYENECVSVWQPPPAGDECCYCCVHIQDVTPILPTPILNVSESQLSRLTQGLSLRESTAGNPQARVGGPAPPQCKPDLLLTPYDLQGVVDPITGMGWLPCGIDPNNQISGCEPRNECTSCSLDLSNGGYLPPGTQVNFPYNFPNYPTIPWGSPMSFWLGDCIYDVDPYNTGERCCYCCACPGGWNMSRGWCDPHNFSPNVPPPTARQPATSFIPSTSSVPPDCGITIDGVFGTNWVEFGWVSCGYNHLGDECDDTPSPTTPNIPIQI